MTSKMIRLLAATAGLACATAAAASEIAIPLPEGARVASKDAVYDCEGEELRVTYINATTISLAVLDINGVTIVASNVISASGAKYAGAQYIWWTKGDSADLYDLTSRIGETPIMSCVAES
jgi:membrane-bound inhibitor of C-type lysozyme